MNDLFAAEQSRPAPAYGSLTPLQERALYDTDRAGWFNYVAEAMAKKLAAGGAESIRIAWPLMSDDYKKAIWPHFNEETRELVRLVRATATRQERMAA